MAVVDNYWEDVFGSSGMPKGTSQNEIYALQSYGQRLGAAEQDRITVFIEKAPPTPKTQPRSRMELGRKVQSELGAEADVPFQAEDSDGEELKECPQCNLPLGSLTFDHSGSSVHCECRAQLLARELHKKEETRKRRVRAEKQRRRREYAIGWEPKHIPLTSIAAGKLACREVPQGMVCLVLQEGPGGRAVRVAATLDPAAAVNLEYLSVALQVRRLEGREPRFSLDPVDPKDKHTMQKKVFMPSWIAGTSVGEVLFQSDYYLKELSMGEYDQPVLGMKSCFDYAAMEDDHEWSAREWFMVRKAELRVSDGNVLIPYVKMGVEAREQVMGSEGKLEDAPITREDHPMVKYAEGFTKNFDLIAERKSVIHHLKEVAKASVLAKYLLDTEVKLEESWFELAEKQDSKCIMEVPQLWNERFSSEIQVKDGSIVDGTIMHGVYGGVDLSLETQRKVEAKNEAAAAAAKAAAKAKAGPAPVQRTTISITWKAPEEPSWEVEDAVVPAYQPEDFSAYGPSMPIATERKRSDYFGQKGMTELPPVRPNYGKQQSLIRTEADLAGVDLNLDSFDLSEAVPLEAPKENWGSEVQSLDQCVAIGGTFWSSIDHGSDAFTAEDRQLLGEVFNPFLSDRRTEGERFVPPEVSDASVAKLRSLVKNEEWVRLQRKEAFFSSHFAMSKPGPLFPSSWKPTATGVTEGPRTALVPRAEYMAEATALQQALKSVSPCFEQATEEGLKFCIYRMGTLEVRTIRDRAGKESIGAVFSTCSPETGSFDKLGNSIKASAKILRVIEYVKQAWDKQRSHRRYYLLVEIEDGRRAVTEQLEDGTMTWEENPVDLDDRNSLAKTLRSADCQKGVSVGGLKDFQATLACRLQLGGASDSMRKRYVRATYNHVCGEDSPGMRPPWFRPAHGQSRRSKPKSSSKKEACRPPSFVGLSTAKAV